MAHASRVRVTGPLASFAPGSARELSQEGYRSKPVADQVRLLAHRSRWLAGKGLGSADLSCSVLEEFLGERRSQAYTLWLSPKALVPLIDYLRRIGVTICEPESEPDPVELLLARYSECLLGTRGIDPTSARGHTDMVRAFVAKRLVDDELDWASLQPADVRAFVLSACRGRSVGSAKLVTTALRSLLGYAHVEGLTPAPLRDVVPAVAGWRPIAVRAAAAADRCPILSNKRVTAHVLRHSAAMRLLESGVGPTVIALWLGHARVDTTAMYMHAHLGIKESALARARMPDGKPRRYRPPDALLAFLQSL